MVSLVFILILSVNTDVRNFSTEYSIPVVLNHRNNLGLLLASANCDFATRSMLHHVLETV